MGEASTLWIRSSILGSRAAGVPGTLEGGCLRALSSLRNRMRRLKGEALPLSEVMFFELRLLGKKQNQWEARGDHWRIS